MWRGFANVMVPILRHAVRSRVGQDCNIGNDPLDTEVANTATSGNMKLDAYLRSKGQTFREFAGHVGYDVAQVHRWATGKRLPPLPAVVRIEAATDGQVTAADFMRSADAETAA